MHAGIITTQIWYCAK